MSLLWTILVMIIIGLIAGAVARLVVPGKQNLSIVATIVLGVIGSFVGGFLARLIFGSGGSLLQPSGIIGSIIGAIIVLLIWIAISRRRGVATP